MAKNEIITSVDGRKLKLTNLEKILYPQTGIVKAQLIEYYLAVASQMLPYLKGRPLTLIRYPDGLDAERFYSKNTPAWAPSWVETVQIEPTDDNIYSMANNKPTLAWMANLAALEFHPMLIHVEKGSNPDHFIFDLDPPPGHDFEALKAVAIKLKSTLENHSYKPYIKTSGSSGLHIYVPILPIYDQPTVSTAVKQIARTFVHEHKETTLQLSKEKRQGKILLDIYRNNKSQTCAAPYSTRGRYGCPISTPLHWAELDSISSSQQFTILNIMDRLDAVEDPWNDFYDSATRLHSNTAPNTRKPETRQVEVPLTTTVQQVERVKVDVTDYLSPMLAIAGKEIADTEDYIFEIKWDGIRVIITKQNEEVAIYSRNGKELTHKFPIIVQDLQKLGADTMVADGEIVALDKDGLPHFGKTIGRMHLTGAAAIARASNQVHTAIYLFDLLYYDGVDSRQQTLEKRRLQLKNSFTPGSHLRYSDSFTDGAALFEAVRLQGMEGIIYKKKDSKYVNGVRSSDWVKIKVSNTDEAFIIGYTAGNGDRSGYFGSLHLAKNDPDGWTYKGRVGTGFSMSTLTSISQQLKQVPNSAKPILDTIEEEHKTTWIEPQYIATVKYASETPNGIYREPVFVAHKKITNR